jgi:hypothetical protein
MTFFRRFFDALATDAPAPPMATAEIAKLLASQGVQTEGDDPVTKVPDVNIEEPKQETTQQEGDKPVAETAKVETTTPAPPKPEEAKTDTKAPETPAPAKPAETAPAAADWKEVLNNHPDHAEVLKAMGFEDKIVRFIQEWKSGGAVNKYLEAATVDYSKLSAEDLMRRQLARDYPEMEQADLEELYRMKVIEQYKLDPDIFSEQDVRRGKILLQADARKLREQYTKEQQDFILPKAPEVDPKVERERQEALQREQEAQKQFDQYRQHITDHNLTKDLMSNKTLTFGEGEEAFKFEVSDPNKLLDLIFDGNKISEKLFDEVGGQRTPNVWKHLLMAAVLDDDNTLITQLGNHFKKLGSKKLVETLENASTPGATTTRDYDSSDPIAALARAGLITGGG